MENYYNQEMKSKPIPINSSPKRHEHKNNTNKYQYNETSFDPCSGSPPSDSNNFINKLEIRYDKLNTN